MGISTCANSSYFEAGSLEVSYYFLALLGIYACLEILIIWKTIRLIIRQPEVLKNGFCILFYICIHFMFLRNIFSFMGGTLICYSKTLYFVIAEYFILIKDVLPFIMSYRIAVMLKTGNISYPGSSCFAKLILFGAVFDIIFYTGFFIYNMITGINLWLLMNATFLGLTMVAIVFNYPTYQMVSFINKRIDKNSSYKELAKWYMLILGVNSYFVTRTTYIILVNLYELLDLGAFNQDMLYGSYMLVYYILTEILPFSTIFIVITDSIEEANDRVSMLTPDSEIDVYGDDSSIN